MTETQAKTLRFLRDAQPCRARQIAEFLWPDSDAHRRSSAAGNSGESRRGVGAWLCAGRYMAKLEKQGWVTSAHRGSDLLYYDAAGYHTSEP